MAAIENAEKEIQRIEIEVQTQELNKRLDIVSRHALDYAKTLANTANGE